MPWLRQTTLEALDQDGKVALLSTELCLLHVLGEAAFSPTRSNLRWVCDSWYLIKTMEPTNWDGFCNAVIHMGLDLPLFVMLGYMARLGALVPEEVMQTLGRTDLSVLQTRKLVYTFLLSLDGAAPAAGKPPWPILERLRITSFRIFPPPSYLSWKFRTQNVAALGSLYLRRPLRYLARRVSGSAK